MRDHPSSHIREALRLVDFLWQTEVDGRPTDTPERRAELERRLEERVRRVGDRTVQHHYRREFRDRLWHMFRGSGAPHAVRGLRGGPGGGPRRAWKSGPVGPAAHAGARPRPFVDVGRLRQQILLALIVSHPALLREESEVLAGLELTAPDLDKLRAEIIKTADQHRNLDSADLKSHLRDRGFAEVLEGLLSPNLYIHAPFARPDAAPGAVRAGWRHTLALYRQDRAKAEIEEAERALANEMTEENFARFVARRTLIETDGSGGAGEEGDDCLPVRENGG